MADRNAEFTAYVSGRRPQLVRTAYLLCGNAAQAEDLVQTALTKLYLAWPRLHDAQQPDAYARRILVNAHRDEHRRPWRRERSVAETPDRATHDEPGTDDAVLRALGRLAPGQRRAVVLRHPPPPPHRFGRHR